MLKHIALTILMLLTLWLPGRAEALRVDSLRFGDHPDKTRMVLELSEVINFRSFVLEGPYRLVIDLPAFDWRVSDISGPANAGVIEVRQGILEPGISRIVLDLNSPAAIHTAFLLPASAGQPHRLVIDFSNVSASQFQNQKGKIFGSLRTGQPQTTTQTAAPPPAIQPASTQAGAIPQRKPAPTYKQPPAKKPMIIIDAGHGGQDPGAIGAGRVYEKNITLATARELQRQLDATGRYRTKLTRTHDKYIKLHKRVEFARKHDGDLFISIHADSIGKSNVRGASIYTLSNKASDAQTAKLAARENQADLIAGVDLSHEDEDVANILIDLAMRDTMNQSKFFANTAVESLGRSGIRILEKPHRYAGFAVLKAPDIPSVLIEIGFMSNRNEAKLLATPNYQRKIAGGLVSSINAYFDTVHKNNNH